MAQNEATITEQADKASDALPSTQIDENSQQTGTIAYRIDANPVTHHTIEKDPETNQKYLVFHRFRRLDNSNIKLYLKREQEIVNERDDIGKGRTRQKKDSSSADENFYDGLILSGYTLPYGLSDADLSAAQAGTSEKYQKQELTKQDMIDLDLEVKQHAIRKMFKCKFVVTSRAKGATGIGFLFAKKGVMTGVLHIPDKENPVFSIPMEFERPSKNQRTELKTGLYVHDDLRGGDLPRTKTTGQPEFGTRFFDRHFGTGSNMEFTDPSEPEKGIPYSDDRKGDFLLLFNPIYKVSIAADIVFSFDDTEQE